MPEMVLIAERRSIENIGFYRELFLVTSIENIGFYKHFFLVTSVKYSGFYRELFLVTSIGFYKHFFPLTITFHIVKNIVGSVSIFF
jgi:hypothetical protein